MSQPCRSSCMNGTFTSNELVRPVPEGRECAPAPACRLTRPNGAPGQRGAGTGRGARAGGGGPSGGVGARAGGGGPSGGVGARAGGGGPSGGRGAGILAGACSSSSGPGRGADLTGWQQGSAHGSARDERQYPHQTRPTGADQVLLAAHPAGHAGRIPVRLRHVEHRLGAELRAVSPAGPGSGLPGLRGLARRGGGRDPGRTARGPVRPQGVAGHRRGNLRGRLDPVRPSAATPG